MGCIQSNTLQTFFNFLHNIVMLLLEESCLIFLSPNFNKYFLLIILHNNILDYFIFWIIPEFNNYSITIKILILIVYNYILFIISLFIIFYNDL
jgi:hypothetical protein